MLIALDDDRLENSIFLVEQNFIKSIGTLKGIANSDKKAILIYLLFNRCYIMKIAPYCGAILFLKTFLKYRIRLYILSF